MLRFLAILVLGGLAASPARAQEQPTLTQALAELIHEALPPASRGDGKNSWDAVSIRISSLVHWHLAPPDKAGPDQTVRRGWLSADGQQVSVTAHGAGENVTSLGFELAGAPFGRDPDDRDLLAALVARGVTVTDTVRRTYPEITHLPLAGATHTLGAEGRDTARLASNLHCTPPMSRAARRCWLTLELALDPG